MFERNGALLLRRFNSYFLPTILMSIALSMSIVVDGIIVGNMLGSDSLAAVNLGLPIMQGYAAIFVLFGMGGSILAAWHLGRHEEIQAGTVFTLSTLSLAVLSIVCVAAGSFCNGELALLLSGGNALAEPLRHYMTPLLYGAPLLILVPGMSYFVRVDGRPALASAILITSNVINLICDILFIRWLGTITAAGLATVVGYGVGLLLLGFYLTADRRELHFTLKGGHLAALFGNILCSGLPGGLSIGLQFVKFLCLNLLVMAVAGKSGMVAFSVCLACLSLASMFISGASQTMMPILGVLYGEGDYAGMRIIFRRSLHVLMAGTIVLIAILELFPQELLLLFGIQGADLPTGARAVRYYAPSLIFDAFIMLMIYYAQTLRKLTIALPATILQNVVILLPCAWLFSRVFGLDGIWISFSVSGAIASLALLALTRHEARRSKCKISSFLMLPTKNSHNSYLDISLRNTIAEAVSISDRATKFCVEHGVEKALALRAGIIVEEMAVNIVRHAGQTEGEDMIDIRLGINEQEIRISFRDAGRPFSPLEYKKKGDAPTVGGIPLIHVLGDQITYSYALGFNNTLVILSRVQKSL